MGQAARGAILDAFTAQTGASRMACSSEQKVRILVRRLTLAQQFFITSLVIVVAGMTGIGFWVANRIETGIVNRTAASTALYVDSLIGRSLQSMATESAPDEDGVDRLDWLLNGTSLGQEIVIFRVWNRDGTIVYSNMPETVGQQFPVDDEREKAWGGGVTAHIGTPEGEVLPEGAPTGSLLEIYSPVRNRDTDEVIAVAEFYYRIDDLKEVVAEAQQRSWLVVGGTGVAIYLLLAVFVQRASNTIAHQQRELASKVERLTELLRQNDDLNERVRTAAARNTALNERFLRRLSAELHDGPAQDISLALLQLDHVYARTANGTNGNGLAGTVTSPESNGDHPGGHTNGNSANLDDLDLIQGSLRRALRDVRGTSTGLLLPQLSQLTLAETVDHVARVHRRRTGLPLEVTVTNIPEEAPTVTKIALYRVIQEALTNGWRHANGAGQAVVVTGEGDSLRIAVSDTGPGFDTATIDAGGEHLGLIGMRERVESLGGEFRVESTTGAAASGTTVVAILPLHPSGERGESDG
jgi:signal transduction histidine kinase